MRPVTMTPKESTSHEIKMEAGLPVMQTVQGSAEEIAKVRRLRPGYIR
jgi:hypothetical protein